jgi:hypothetical protein
MGKGLVGLCPKNTFLRLLTGISNSEAPIANDLAANTLIQQTTTTCDLTHFLLNLPRRKRTTFGGAGESVVMAWPV